MQRSRIVLAALALGYAGAVPTAAADAAAIGVDPASGPPGQLITVRGTGFCDSRRCGLVRIQVSTTVVAKGVLVSPRGSFVRVGIHIPGGLTPGEVAVIASQRLANGRRREAFATFEVLVLGNRGQTKPTTRPATTATGTTSEGGPTRPPSTTSDSGDEGSRTTRKHTGPTPAETKTETERNAAAREGEDGGRTAWWPFAAVVLALAAAGAALALRARRRRG